MQRTTPDLSYGQTVITVPAGLVAATVAREGEAGQKWLDELPGLVTAACDRWDCVIDGSATHGGVALVVLVQHRRGPAVLKISFPHPGNLGEGPALRSFAGEGAVELFEADQSGLELLLERCRPLTLAEHAAIMEDYPVEEAIEVAGELARRLAVAPGPGVTPLADTTQAWTEELLGRVDAFPDALPRWAVDQAVETIQLFGSDQTATMLHGDLHFGNIMWAYREPWFMIDPKGWSGTAAFDAFTVIIGRREILDPGPGFYDAIVRRVYRFSAAAMVHPDLALACCQARAVSAFYHRLEYPHREGWFDTQFLLALALSGDNPHPEQHARLTGLLRRPDCSCL